MLKKIISFIILTLLSAAIIFLIFFSIPPTKKQLKGENEFNIYCGSCHVLPNPANIPKSIWSNKVLPEMAARMGYIYGDFKAYKYSKEENHYIKLSKIYPEEQLIDSITWKKIYDYVLNLAPEKVPNTPRRQGRNSELSQFNASLNTLNYDKPSRAIINIKYNDDAKKLLIGDIYGQLHEWGNPNPIIKTFDSPVISSVIDYNTFYLTEIGNMNPSEIPLGTIYSMTSDSIVPLSEVLHRPVYTEVNDLNEDGKKEIIICEFGHHTGALSMLIKKDYGYEKKILLELPGSIKVDVVDMNGDGKKDIVAVFAQGREGIYIFYQKENLEFDVEQVIAMGPEYGSSWFSLLDYNNDGFMDIVVANGDNADYSNFLKPYHGVRLFINDGTNKFEEKWFYPINGATRVLAEDFDNDGDFDFAVLSFFPDFAKSPEEGFVYLENKDSKNYEFSSFTTSQANRGNWLIMDKGDFDQDGDTDIMLGNFNLLAPNTFTDMNTYDLLFLENKLVK